VPEIIKIPPQDVEEVCHCICHGLVAHDYDKNHKCCEECPGCGLRIKNAFYEDHFINCKQFM